MDTKVVEAIVAALEQMPVKLGVISTVSEEGTPHSATVYYTLDKNLNIYFATRRSTKKFKNLTSNPHIAFLSSAEQPPRTVQLEGKASIVDDSDEQRTFFTELLNHATKRYPLPPFSQMMESEIVLMKIVPHWARLGDFDVLRETEMFQETTFN